MAAEIEGSGEDPRDIAKRFAETAQRAYSEDKDVSRMLMIGRLGISFCLHTAAQSPDRELANTLVGLAKQMAYNLSANAWRGWDDPGIVISPTEERVGFDLALLNLRLGRELQRGPEPLGNAHWLSGAYQMAIGNHSDAESEFLAAEEQFGLAGKPDQNTMCRGYRMLSRHLATPSDADCNSQFHQILQQLRDSGSEDGKFFSEQLETAYRVFSYPDSSAP